MNDTAPDKLRAAAARLNWYAEHVGYITDDNGQHHAGAQDARDALALAEQINALGDEPPST